MRRVKPASRPNARTPALGLYVGSAFSYKPGMNAPKYQNYQDRQTASAKAKSALLERFRARPAPDSPEVLEQQAARAAIAAARNARIAERQAAREAAAVRLAAEQAALAAAEKIRAAEQVAQDAAHSERALELAAQQKAARDARYAARNARRR